MTYATVIAPHRIKTAASILMLVAGMVIYILFRSGDMLVFRLTDALGMHTLTGTWRDAVCHITLPEWALYCLPNGLWAMSYVLLVDTMYHRCSITTRMAWGAVIPVCGVAGELLQALRLIPGTFDWGDVTFMTLPYIVYYTVIIIHSLHKTNLS